MFVGIAKIDILIPGNSSLKGKRKVIRSIIDRTKNRFNVSVAEVDDNILWQRSKLGITLVGPERKYINSLLNRLIDSIYGSNLVEILNTDVDILKY
jgi:hypothetical protein